MKKIYEGVNYKSGKYKFNYKKDDKTDIIKLEKMQNKIFFNTTLGVKMYYGYSFSSESNNDIKRNFLHAIKDKKISSLDYNSFIEFAVNRLNSTIKLSDFDAILCPKSGSPLAFEIGTIIKSKSPKALLLNDAIIKNNIEKITIDYDSYLKNTKLEDEKKKRIKQLDQDLKYSTKTGGFQMKKVFKSRAKFFHDFLTLNPDKKNSLNKIHDKNVLIVDDYKVSGATTQELIKLVQTLNPKQIYVFVLIKK